MQDRVRNDEEMISNLKAWFRNAELETKRFCQNLGPDAVAMRRQMIEQLGKQNAYVFFVMRSRNEDQHQCVTLNRDQIEAWQDYVNQVKEKGWYPDPTRVIVYHEPIPSPSRSRSRPSLGLGPKRKRAEVYTHGPKQKKSRDLPLDMLD